ncbi:hypothetical protein KC19_3G152500 [Ceratodon purpureus]|uniref:Uncharacterized protein n=1 Tax=Ceratodon purpureus TaxID=3225 RepID=A0A8T0IKV2_CERPU|nr:hypothetical protein KC19_3G152500 [Ceratodon purpureus]
MGLTGLKIACESLQCLPNSIGDLKLLDRLSLRRCDNLKRLPKTLGGLTILETVIIDRSSIRKLPRCIGQLSGLRRLEMKGCKNLQKLPTSKVGDEGVQEFAEAADFHQKPQRASAIHVAGLWQRRGDGSADNPARPANVGNHVRHRAPSFPGVGVHSCRLRRRPC